MEPKKFYEQYMKNPIPEGLIATSSETVISVKVHEEFVREILNRIDKVNIAEPCEPDCTPERHARHSGSWDHYLRIDEELAAIRNEYGI